MPTPLTPSLLPPLLSGRIYGVGVDLCHSPRIAAAHARHGERLVQRILTPLEQAEFANRTAHNPSRGLRYLASRFAAKEALAKALGTGLRGVMGFQSASVLNDDLGKPIWQTHGGLTNLFQTEQLLAHLSLSDEGEYVLAFCVIEKC